MSGARRVKTDSANVVLAHLVEQFVGVEHLARVVGKEHPDLVKVRPAGDLVVQENVAEGRMAVARRGVIDQGLFDAGDLHLSLESG